MTKISNIIITTAYDDNGIDNDKERYGHSDDENIRDNGED